jgi:hypothetical protein
MKYHLITYGWPYNGNRGVPYENGRFRSPQPYSGFTGFELPIGLLDLCHHLRCVSLLIVAALLIVSHLLVISSAENLGCTLQRPGPFLEGHKGTGYRKELHEDSSEEHLTLTSGEVVEVLTNGCEDSWGWKIKLTSKTMSDKPTSIKPALSLMRAKILPVFLKDTDTKGGQGLFQQALNDLLVKTDKAIVKQSATMLLESLCNRQSTLNPESKTCVEPITLSIQQKADHFSIVIDFQDLEN